LIREVCLSNTVLRGMDCAATSFILFFVFPVLICLITVSFCFPGEVSSGRDFPFCAAFDFWPPLAFPQVRFIFLWLCCTPSTLKILATPGPLRVLLQCACISSISALLAWICSATWAPISLPPASQVFLRCVFARARRQGCFFS
jgi:hypothetical protein